MDTKNTAYPLILIIYLFRRIQGFVDVKEYSCKSYFYNLLLLWFFKFRLLIEQNFVLLNFLV